ncbi:hypothetical protein PINS_up006878 [Pythium insidiosum]|nr:hypothetical protein PINS_up006878 [Pythium insidiosum]
MLYAIGDRGIDANKTFVGSATGEPNWLSLLDDNVRDLDGSSSIVVALRENGSTWLPLNTTASFPDASGPFQSIACDGAVLCASQGTDDQVLCTTQSLTTWYPTGMRLRQIALSGGQLAGVTRNGSVWVATVVDDNAERTRKSSDRSQPSHPSQSGTNNGESLKHLLIVHDWKSGV